MGDLIDPSLLEGLTEEQRKEALAAAEAAKRAEERAEQRALERAVKQRELERQKEKGDSQKQAHSNPQQKANSTNPKITFVSKRQRQKQQADIVVATAAQSPSASKRVVENGNSNDNKTTSNGLSPSSKKVAPPPFSSRIPRGGRSGPTYHSDRRGEPSASWTAKEREVIRKTYLGTAGQNSAGGAAEAQSSNSNNRNSKDNKRKKNSGGIRSKKATFRFEWDNTDDTLDDRDPLYAPSAALVANKQRNKKQRRSGYDDYEDGRNVHQSVLNKPLAKMTTRDWRIFRENYEIVVKGGRAPPPLRSFREANLNPALLDAIENVMRYRDPTPIQRQTIPIGMQRRDLIGIAETGSGKTCAFGVPLLQYLMSLPRSILDRVAEDGPLALVMAPTRELALQIHGEFEKLTSRQSYIKTCGIVGGQSIQFQAQELRDGVHVVVGTPGRMNDCIEMAYLVLNQCCYIVLDEADRMIDMGFAPQMESILDAMGGQLKSENEQEAYVQEEQDRTNKGGLPRHRVTAMFSATMPLEVERIAKRYLRHPAVISIGDQDSGKNARIVQRVIFLPSPNKKESALRDLILNPRYIREKVIVFVNEKKHADGIGRMVERIGRSCVVLHGGKSQEQREEALEAFRRGGVVLVATDVAGRGLDIPNVAHVINYDLPSRSIDNYSHRIGRTGRAGKEGLATSLMTDEDESIMAPLKAYLESTGSQVPEKLARHPAASATTQGNVIY